MTSYDKWVAETLLKNEVKKTFKKRVDKQTSLWYDIKVATAISTD